MNPPSSAEGGRLKSTTAKNWRLDASVCKAFDVIDSFTYDSLGRAQDRTTELKAPEETKGKWKQIFGYDGASRLTEQTYPSCMAGCTSTERKVTTTLDMGLPVAAADASRSYTSGVSYQPNGLLSSLVHSNGVTFTQAPDPHQMPRPRSLTASKGNTALWSTGNYEYDGSGNIKAIGTESYSYDNRSRLKQAMIPAAGTKKYRAYAYDRYGNLTSVSSGESLATLVAWPIDVDAATNRLRFGYYNLAGSLLSWNGAQYRWDPLQQLASVTNGSVTWTHTYDANGERVWSWNNAGAGRTDLFSGRDSSGRLLREFKKVAPATTTTAEDYIYLGSRLLATVKPNEDVRHMDVDHLGTVRLVTNDPALGSQLQVRQHHLWPYGEEYTSQSDDEQMRFTGHERDLWATSPSCATSCEANNTCESCFAEAAEDDLDYMHARYYRPLLGRFLSVDPVGGNPRAPQSWNRYSYVQGNPLSRVDPDGRAFAAVILAVVEAAATVKDFVDTATILMDPAESALTKVTAVTLTVAGGPLPLGGYAKNLTPKVVKLVEEGADAFSAAKWTLGQGKPATKWANQMARRGWNEEQITEALSTKGIPARNAVNPGHPATRHVHPTTGQSVVIDNKTNEISHVGGKDFDYSHWDLP